MGYGQHHRRCGVAVLIIGLLALIIGLFGYRLVHKYELVS